MKDYSLPLYQKIREWIKISRENGKDWDYILYANRGDDAGLQVFLELQQELSFWPEITVDDWKAIVALQKTAEERTRFIGLTRGSAMIYDPRSENAVTVPTDPYSSWQLYKAKLKKDGFKQESIDEIEDASIKILKRLNNNTQETGTVKGLVIGNVQSGKTANMAALMAMAADWGWNMFIVLSGTIDNLRVQTQTRLFNDLNQQGNIFWRALEHLSKDVDIAQKAQNLHFDEGSRERYFTVCLKNQTRLRDLIQWAQADKNKQGQMKIIVIDDEADQAGINTERIDLNSEEQERRIINSLICNLINGKNEKGEEIEAKYRAMNYIGYTATPYANVLNEDKPESTYPRNFITTLSVSKEYFGPQQIFGYSGDSVDYSGLDIVRTIGDDELGELKNIHDGLPAANPDSLLDAIAWFLCGVACMRIWGHKKPVSMLVHTSQKIGHHSSVASVIETWISESPRETILDRTRKVWERETERFSLKEFREQYPEYGRTDDQINQYPNYSDVEEQIKIVLDAGISNIPLDDEGDLTYHAGIHLCVDNCSNNGIIDGMRVRLAYPDPKNMPDPAPAFIVVGGATLSRGLTLEGLISTFFIRSVGQADTLMQMGRWFGYRKGYELLPRIWMTEKTRDQFIFLAALDQELRDYILYMDVNHLEPSKYGPKVKNSPKVSFIRITAKNRMQSATEADMDYSGASNQTYLFDDDAEILKENIRTTEDFLVQLGDRWIGVDTYGCRKNAAVWRDVSFKRIRAYIEKFKFQERLGVFNDTTPLLEWIGDATDNDRLGPWNVVVAGKSDNTNGTWTLPDGTVINKVSRSRKLLQKDSELEEPFINIGALRDPRDLLCDIEVDEIADPEIRKEVIQYLKSNEVKAAMAYRDMAGLRTTPQLLIYRVDKNSKVRARGTTGKTRVDLNAPEDLIGICLYIPGGRIGTSYASTVSIKMNNDIFDGGADLEGANED